MTERVLLTESSAERYCLDSCTTQLEFIKDNLECVRLAVVSEAISDLQTIDNAIYSVVLYMERLIDEITDMFEGEI